MASLSKLIRNPSKAVYLLDKLHLGWLIPDKTYLQMKYKASFGKKMDLNNPITYNEKLNWLKLYDHKPEYSALVDKYKVREYIADKIGGEYLIPLLGVWEKFDDIDFQNLPDQFVLKCTHDSGGLVICKDKDALDVATSKKKIERALKRNFYYQGREWPYKDVPRKIIAEKYMTDETYKELRDYKFFCFNGEPKIMFVGTERQVKGEEVKFDFFDMDYKHLDIKNGHPNAKLTPEKPINFEKMKELAKKLSKNIPHVRVDFYEVNGDIFFGELTFYHFSGMVPFIPEEWDYKLGEWIKLPDKN